MRIGITCVMAILVLTQIAPQYAEAKSPAQAAGRAAFKKIAKIKPSHLKKFGSLHIFKKDLRLRRFSDHPANDLKRGLRRHSYWEKPKKGRIGNAGHVRKRLNINHGLRGRETAVVKKGWAYHESPIKGGMRGSRQVIIERPIPRNYIKTHPLQK